MPPTGRFESFAGEHARRWARAPASIPRDPGSQPDPSASRIGPKELSHVLSLRGPSYLPATSRLRESHSLTTFEDSFPDTNGSARPWLCPTAPREDSYHRRLRRKSNFTMPAEGHGRPLCPGRSPNSRVNWSYFLDLMTTLSVLCADTLDCSSFVVRKAPVPPFKLGPIPSPVEVCHAPRTFGIIRRWPNRCDVVTVGNLRCHVRYYFEPQIIDVAKIETHLFTSSHSSYAPVVMTRGNGQTLPHPTACRTIRMKRGDGTDRCHHGRRVRDWECDG